MDQGKKFEKRMPRTPTKHTGVYTRESQIKTHKGHPDICFDISYKKDGRLIWEKAGYQSEGYSLKLASQIRVERLRTIRHGEDLPKEKKRIPLFSEMAELYLKWGDENKKDSNDRSRYKNYLEEAIGKKRLNDISPFDLEKIKSTMIKQGLSPATVRHMLTLIRAIFNKALIWRKYQGANPAKGVKFPTLNNKRERFLTFEEAKLLLDELKKGSRSTYEIALLALHTGLRAGEIFKIRGLDVDLANDIINVVDPKNKFSRKAYMTSEIKELLRAKTPRDLNEPIFKPRIHKNGKILRVSGFFQRTADELFNKGIEDPRQRLVFHSLRHSFGSWLAIQGTPLITIMELMGHKTLSMTQRYSHLTPSVKQEAIRMLQNNIQNKNGSKVLEIAQRIKS